jgi:hypothetical protein
MLVGVVALLAVLVVSFAVALRLAVPKLTEEAVQAAVLSTITSEAPASFYVTGTVRITATSSVRSATVLLPGVLDVEISENRAEVKAPGVISYGFDVRLLRAEHIRLVPGSAGADTVEVVMPPLAMHAVDVDLEALDVRTERGWLTLGTERSDALTQQALDNLRTALRREGHAYLDRSLTPYEHTARALRLLLAPPLEAAGLEQPHFRIVFEDAHEGRTMVVEPEG